MKALLLLRHAHPRDNRSDVRDHDRPLDARGVREAKCMGRYLESSSLEPSLVLCSSAQRAADTLHHLLPHLPVYAEVLTESALYLAECERLLARLQAVDDSREAVLVIAHNPGISELAYTLSGAGDAATLQRMAGGLPPAALAQLALDSDTWCGLAPRAARLLQFKTPCDLAPRRERPWS